MSSGSVLVEAPFYIPKRIHEMETRKPLSYRTVSIRLDISIKVQTGHCTQHIYLQKIHESSVDPSQRNLLTRKDVNKGEQTY